MSGGEAIAEARKLSQAMKERTTVVSCCTHVLHFSDTITMSLTMITTGGRLPAEKHRRDSSIQRFLPLRIVQSVIKRILPLCPAWDVAEWSDKASSAIGGEN